MVFYEELSYNLKLKDLYRFQGGLTKNLITCNLREFDFDLSKYLYLSKGLSHHYYFLDRRIKQLLEGLIFDGEPVLTKQCKGNKGIFVVKAIKSLQSEQINISLESLRLRYVPYFLEIMSQNAIHTLEKPGRPGFIERVDYKEKAFKHNHEGGYGLVEEWLALFSKMVILIAKKSLTEKDIIEYLKIVRQNCFEQSHRLDASSIIASGHINYFLNPSLESDFTRFEITNLLETILEKGLVNPGSDLSLNPKETIKKVTDEYQKTRVLTLKTLNGLKATREI